MLLTHKHKQIQGIVPGLGGWREFVYVFFEVITWWGRIWSGDFPDSPFSLSRPTKSTYKEQSRKGLRHNLDLSRKKRETPVWNPPIWKPPFLVRAELVVLVTDIVARLEGSGASHGRSTIRRKLP